MMMMEGSSALPRSSRGSDSALCTSSNDSSNCLRCFTSADDVNAYAGAYLEPFDGYCDLASIITSNCDACSVRAAKHHDVDILHSVFSVIGLNCCLAFCPHFKIFRLLACNCL